MVMNKSLSIIIPVYNEESQLEACLQSIEAQTVQPDEVIVVDNNSTDRSMEVARRFPFVTIIQETRQGRGFAYSAGFNAAHGDILGRINGDTILVPTWVERVKYDFVNNGQLRGVTGLGLTETVPFSKRFLTTAWSRGYYLWNMAYFRIQTFWGACFAVDRQAWLAVRNDICTDDAIVHDDQDLAYLFAGRGFEVGRDNKLRIKTPGSEYNDWPKFLSYRRRQFNTYRFHKQKGTLNQPGTQRASWWVSVALFSWGWLPIGIFYIFSFIRGTYAMMRQR